MAKKQQNNISIDLVAGLCGLFFTLSGVGAINDALYRPLNSWDWKVGVGLIIFGSMIMGVAVNRASNNGRSKKSSVAANKQTGRKNKKA